MALYLIKYTDKHNDEESETSMQAVNAQEAADKFRARREHCEVDGVFKYEEWR